MNRTAADIRRACAKVLAQEKYEQLADGTTFCNIALHAILTELDMGAVVWDYERQRPMLANYIADKMENLCKELTFNEAFTKANEGSVVIAAMKMPYHGHVALVYPFPGRYTSGKWKRADVPCVANIGKENGIMPLNWAFGGTPRLWLLAD